VFYPQFIINLSNGTTDQTGLLEHPRPWRKSKTGPRVLWTPLHSIDPSQPRRKTKVVRKYQAYIDRQAPSHNFTLHSWWRPDRDRKWRHLRISLPPIKQSWTARKECIRASCDGYSSWGVQWLLQILLRSHIQQLQRSGSFPRGCQGIHPKVWSLPKKAQRIAWQQGVHSRVDHVGRHFGSWFHPSSQDFVWGLLERFSKISRVSGASVGVTRIEGVLRIRSIHCSTDNQSKSLLALISLNWNNFTILIQ